MGILSQQSIITHQGAVKDNPRWGKNLGASHNWSGFSWASAGYLGERYAPPGLESFIGNVRTDRHRGILGRFMTGGIGTDQYGPGFSRLPNFQPGQATSPSLLTSWAWNLWGYTSRHGSAVNNNASRMVRTFTRNPNTRSLRDKGIGSNRGQTPVASGGPWKGWEAGHEYGNFSGSQEPFAFTGNIMDAWEQLHAYRDEGVITNDQFRASIADIYAVYAAFGWNSGAEVSPIDNLGLKSNPTLIKTGLRSIGGIQRSFAAGAEAARGE